MAAPSLARASRGAVNSDAAAQAVTVAAMHELSRIDASYHTDAPPCQELADAHIPQSPFSGRNR